MEKYFSIEIAQFNSELANKNKSENNSKNRPLVLCLSGPLGAGKTTFTKEYLNSLGFDCAQVQSPTFLKVLEYEVPGLGQVLHLDCYRIEDLDGIEALALESYADAQIWIVEWPEKFIEYLQTHEVLRHVLGLKSYWDFDFENHQKKKMDPIRGSGGRGDRLGTIQDREGGLRWSRKLF